MLMALLSGIPLSGSRRRRYRIGHLSDVFYRDAAATQQTATAALASGIHAVFWLSLLLGLLSLVFAFFLKKPHPQNDAA